MSAVTLVRRSEVARRRFVWLRQHDPWFRILLVKDGDSGWARIREQNARYWPRFSDSEYQRRYREIRKLMELGGSTASS